MLRYLMVAEVSEADVFLCIAREIRGGPHKYTVLPYPSLTVRIRIIHTKLVGPELQGKDIRLVTNLIGGCGGLCLI